MTRRTALLALAATSTLTLSALASTASADDGAREDRQKVRLAAHLESQNGSGATGTASATVRGTTIEKIKVRAEGLTPDGPHVMHIHYGEQALNECPTAADDRPFSDGRPADGFVSAAEGVPSYGPIVVSLTTSGGTGAGLADAFAIKKGAPLARAPLAEDGVLRYERRGIRFTDVDGTGYGADGSGTAEQIAASVRDGEGVLVIHGVDYDDSGAYDVNSVRGAEEDLVPASAGIPAEAVDPAACGVLEVVRSGSAAPSAGARH